MIRFHSRPDTGATIIGTIFAVSIGVVAVAALVLFVGRGFDLAREQFEQYQITEDTRIQLARMVDNLRNARTVDIIDDGLATFPAEYWLQSGNDNEIIFYANVDSDIEVEKVRYFLEDGDLKRGIIDPFDSENEESIQTLIEDLENESESTPLFRYYVTGGTSEVNTPVVSKGFVNRVGITLVQDVDPNQEPSAVSISTIVALRAAPGRAEALSSRQCSDGIDNDNDGLVDFPLDDGCDDGLDNTESDGAACSDFIDNDSDGFIDFPDDTGCADADDTDEASTIECDDGIDNDGDGFTDTGDLDCDDLTDPSEGPKKACEDGLDNDGDGHIDFEGGPAAELPDPGCASAGDESELGTLQCDDGEDNDGDGLIDLEDVDYCSLPSDDDEGPAFGICNDGLDNDGDGHIDFEGGPAAELPDPGCSSHTDTSELGTNECDDGIDNDGDGLIDLEDVDYCSLPSDADEGPDFAICNDGLDNDGDGHIDFEGGPAAELPDPGCSGYTDSSELGTTQCDDGIDNDDDGLIDLEDVDYCSLPSDDDEGPEAGDTQCSDLIDNDFDTFIDYPDDPECLDANDDDESIL